MLEFIGFLAVVVIGGLLIIPTKIKVHENIEESIEKIDDIEE
jgi:hypothetical protein